MKLNEAQRVIAEEVHGPMLVIAGAGSGKTTALVKRIETLLEQGVPSTEILPITFTRKAGKELELRLDKKVKAFTFHKLGLFLMRHYINKNYVPLDEEELEFIIENICKELRLEYKTKIMYRLLEVKKELGADYVDKMVIVDKEDVALQEIAMKYEKFKEEMFLADFDDLLFNLYKFAKGGAKWQYVLLDEAQDSSEFEYKILTELCATDNITVVGDTSQSIYRFKGGRPENLLDFQKNFNARIVRMDINYRSLPEIVEAANSLIKNNNDVFYLEMSPERIGSSKVDFRHSNRPATEIFDIIKNSGHTNFFVLGRTWADVDFYYEKLSQAGLPVARRTPVDVSTETHDIHNLFTLIENKTNEYMLHWYLGYFLDADSLEEVKGRVVEAYHSDSCLPIKPRKILREKLDALRDCPQGKKAIFSLLPSLRNRGISKMVFNLMDGATLEDYFTAVHIAQERIDNEFEGVVFTTVHQVKGLQKKGVIVVNAVEDKFPLKPRAGVDLDQHYKDERNLMYVAVTRAEDELYVVAPKKIKPFGKVIETEVSRYIREFIS